MATFKICIFKHQRRADEKYPVSIRVCWKRQYGYIKTEFYVTDKQINKKAFVLKDSFIIRELDRRIAWKIQCKLPPKTKRFCPLVLK